MEWFYEIRDTNNSVLKRDGGFADQDAAKTAARVDANKMRNSSQPDKPDIGRILVGQNVEKPRRQILRSKIRHPSSVVDFVTAKAPSFNKIQQSSTSKPQTIQQESLRI